MFESVAFLRGGEGERRAGGLGEGAVNCILVTRKEGVVVVVVVNVCVCLCVCVCVVFVSVELRGVL